MVFKKFRISVVFDKWGGKAPGTATFRPRRTIVFAFAPHNRRRW
ncbi:hypothetical protein Agau_C201478 [Agrobacterium tumefaciens F2]|nr:hypothetical protein Agau_C201478 [Agrobacterium tumefaciens F2]